MDAEALALIDMFYQATLEPGMWATALAGITGLLRADHAYLAMNNQPTSATPFIARTGMGDADVQRFLSPQASRLLAPLLNSHLASLPPGGAVVSSSEVHTDTDFERSGYYNEIVRPLGTFYAAGISHDDSRLPLSMWVCRSRQKGGFVQGESQALGQLFPHLIRAQLLHQRLRISNEQAVGLTTIIERLGEAAIVLDATGRSLIVNARATGILRQGDGLVQVAGQLQAVTPALTEQLRRAVALAAVSPADCGQRLHLPRRDHRLPLLLDIMPAWRLGIAEPGLRAPRVVIFIKEPDASLQFDQVALIETFGLTRRECEIVCLLAGGMSVNAIAVHLTIRPGTVRHNLKSAFEKTEVHNQAALVALVRSFAS